MICPNCNNIIITTVLCPYCSRIFCSLSCLESHYSLDHNLNLFHKNESGNNIFFQHSTQINSIFLVKGILNTNIYYDPIYSLKNFIAVYQRDGRLKTIGSGSYGQVYLGMNIIDKKYYAIKHMDKKNIFAILNTLLNIQKEIDIQSRINHPNIVKLFYVKETETSYDLIMEYAKNGNLFHYIRRNRCLSEDESFSIFIQVVNAINFLHQNDLIHRDIKPENILLFENNIVKLCDFGWCVKLNGYQRATFCGTTEYMSPELVKHEVYGKEIDTWSLGVLLYEMIHGYSPFKPNKNEFEAEDVIENIIKHNIKFKKQVTDRCKKLIYGLLDSNIYNRYTVEDIFNSEFVKYYENIENNRNRYNNNNYDFINNKSTTNQINNILYSPKFEMNNNINIHMSMDYKNYICNIQLPERNNSYDIKNNKKEKEINVLKNSGGVYESYIKNANSCQNNSFIKDYEDNNKIISYSNINDNICNSVINFDSISTEKKERNLKYNKSEDNFYKINYIKRIESKKSDLHSSYNADIDSRIFGEVLNEENNEKESINSNNNYFYEAKNFINDKTNKNNDDNGHILKISYLSNSQIINDENKNNNEEPQDKVSRKKSSDKYIFNNHFYVNKNNLNRINQSKISLMKRKIINDDYIKNISLASNQTPEKNFSDIQSQNLNSTINNNNDIKTPNKSYLIIGKDNYKLFKKTPLIKRFIIDSNNNKKNMSKSEISDLTDIKISKEKEPVDNIHRKSPHPKEEKARQKKIILSINLFNKNSNHLIKNIKKINKNKENTNSNTNIYNNFNFDQPKKNLLTDSNSNKNFNLSQISSQNETENTQNMNNQNSINDINSNINHLFIKTENKNPKDRIKITKNIYKSNNSLDNESNIYYKTEIKNKINNTTEQNNPDISTNSNILFENIETIPNENKTISKEKINPILNLSKSGINFNVRRDNYHELLPSMVTKNILNLEEKRPENSKKRVKKVISINLNSPNKEKYKKGLEIVKLGGVYLGENRSEVNIRKPLNSNNKLNLKSKDEKTPINKSNRIYKDKSNIMKKGIKKIYIYNHQLKNIHEKEKLKIPDMNINKFKKIEKIKFKDISFDNRHKRKAIINHKKYIKTINQNKSNINNNISNFKDNDDERNKTPEKKSIFNRIQPNILIESFKKELEKKTNMSKAKYNLVKK